MSCITKRFVALGIEISRLKAFVSDGEPVIVGEKEGVTAKLKKDFSSTMFLKEKRQM